MLNRNRSIMHILNSFTRYWVLLLVATSVTGLAQAYTWKTTWPGLPIEYEWGEYVCMDADHNVYVAGRKVDTHGADDFLIAKYDSNGTEQWSRIYDGGTGSPLGYDRVAGIGVDGQGNVYVTGKSIAIRAGGANIPDIVTIKYNAAGTEQWLQRLRTLDGGDDVWEAPTDLHVDGNGNVVITGDGGGIFLTLKYDTNGVEQWQRRWFDPWHGVGAAVGVDVDSNGNIYVSGSFTDDNAYGDYVTIKYGPSGTELWVSRYHVEEQHDFLVTDMDVTEAGIVAVTGYTCLEDGCTDPYDYDMTTVAYNANGVELWHQTYAGPGDGIFVDDFAEGVAIDGAGNVYVTGISFQAVNCQSDIITIKYLANGVQDWMRLFNQTTSDPIIGNSVDAGHDIGVDGNGNVYVTGVCHFYNVVDADEEMVTLKYTNAGTLSWSDTISADEVVPTEPEVGFAIAVDAGGNVAVTGYTMGLVTLDDMTTAFYAGTGIDVLFEDGFESGDTSRWSAVVGD